MKRLQKAFQFYKKDDCEEHYDMQEVIGTGSFASVRKGISREDNSIWAIKVIEKAQLDAEDEIALQTEVKILETVDHPNVVQLRECYDCAKHYYMVMEMMTGGELFDRIVKKEKYTEGEARDVVRQICDALNYCHKKGIVHRDLKPENLLYSDDTDDAVIKIADFGLAKLAEGDLAMQTACGTPGYVAPEILKAVPYTEAVDLWSVGVIMYILLCGFPPFYDENNAKLFSQIKRGSFQFPSPYWDKVSDQAKDLIKKLLVVDAKKRYNTLETLSHPWVAHDEAYHRNDLTQDVTQQLKKMKARRKLRANMIAARTAVRMRMMMAKH